MELPHSRQTIYGKTTIDRTADGKAFVVTHEPSNACVTRWGKSSNYNVFMAKHTAFAYFFALLGPRDPLVCPKTGRRKNQAHFFNSQHKDIAAE